MATCSTKDGKMQVVAVFHLRSLETKKVWTWDCEMRIGMNPRLQRLFSPA